jgi:hypothetical protein
MSGAELIAIISVGATALGTLITTVFTSMSLSRCKNINCCWECILCDRELVKDEVIARQVEINAENNNI